MTDQNVYLSTTDAANRLGVSPRTVLAWVRAGHVIGTKLPNNRYAVLASEIDRLGKSLNIKAGGMVTPETTTPTEPEAKPIQNAKITDRDGDTLVLLYTGYNVTLSASNGNHVALGFDPDTTPHTVKALKALMVAIEKDGGTVER